jgi:hypothetical protein
MDTLIDRCRVGIKVGLVAAVLYSAYVTLAYLITDGALLDSRGLTLPAVLLTYLAGGVVGGLTYGVLSPLERWRVGAAVVGAFVLLPVFLGAAVVLPNLDLGSHITWIAVGLAAVLVGGIGGFLAWEPDSG